MGNAAKIVLQEWRLDGSYTHFALLALVPFLLAVSLVRLHCSLTYNNYRHRLS